MGTTAVVRKTTICATSDVNVGIKLTLVFKWTCNWTRVYNPYLKYDITSMSSDGAIYLLDFIC